ncbi:MULTISPECIES: neutral zinc metallopeptidase [Nonomuraea]|uniref:Neutral zinc metallopeptidase n=1 Tax=Nonomuraea mangrovi TaxID=2316207 RepID=A0ABW4SSV2_9ACTN
MTARPLLAALLILVLAACGGSVGRSATTEVQGDSFEEDVKLAQVYTEQFWAAQFERLGRTYKPVTEFIPYRGDNGPACGGEPAARDNAFYCPAGHFIAYDQDWLEGLWNKLGDGSTYLIIPHEIGHAVQAQLGTQFELNVQRELQADCYAGGALAGIVKAGVLRADPGDESELMLNLETAGDPTDDWFNPDAHGTAQQRQRSFLTGYTNGVGAC